tara:strand:- start:59857 stop:60024 length:168 start_codon:yes stop_codon:yes gene_type:complete
MLCLFDHAISIKVALSFAFLIFSFFLSYSLDFDKVNDALIPLSHGLDVNFEPGTK